MKTPKRKPQKPAHGRTAKTTRTRKLAPAVPRFSETYERALKDYEHALGLFHKKDYAGARVALQALLKASPDENEICDRAHRYLAICAERLGASHNQPRTVEDLFHLGVYHLNRADTKSALREFEKALEMNSRSDLVHYAIASAHAMAGDKARSIAALQESIRLNEKNRIQAQGDPDFDRIRDEHEFIQLVEPEGAGA